MSSLQEVVSKFISPYKTILLSFVAFILFAVFGYYLYTQYGTPIVEKKNEDIMSAYFETQREPLPSLLVFLLWLDPHLLRQYLGPLSWFIPHLFLHLVPLLSFLVTLSSLLLHFVRHFLVCEEYSLFILLQTERFIIFTHLLFESLKLCV